MINNKNAIHDQMSFEDLRMNLGGPQNPVSYMITSSTGSRQSTRQLSSLYNGSTTLLYGGNKLGIQPSKLFRNQMLKQNTSHLCDVFLPGLNKLLRKYFFFKERRKASCIRHIEAPKTVSNISRMWSEVVVLPLIICNQFSNWFLSAASGDFCMIDVWILCRRVIAPDNDIIHITNMHFQPL